MMAMMMVLMRAGLCWLCWWIKRQIGFTPSIKLINLLTHHCSDDDDDDDDDDYDEDDYDEC